MKRSSGCDGWGRLGRFASLIAWAILFPGSLISADEQESESNLTVVRFEEEPEDDSAKLERDITRLVWGDKDFVSLFNGEDLTGWTGGGESYSVDDGVLVSADEGTDQLRTVKEYGDFILRLEFKLTAGGNNGIGIRVPKGVKGNATDTGMEIQILDDSAPAYRNEKAHNRCGTIHGVLNGKKAQLKPVGEWNQMIVWARGDSLMVLINGKFTVNAKLSQLIANGAVDGRPHNGLKRKSGQITLCAWNSRVDFRKIAVREFAAAE